MNKTKDIITIEDDSDEIKKENECSVQSSESLIQSTTGDWDECEAPDSNNNAEKCKNTFIGHILSEQQYVSQSGLRSLQPTTTALLMTAKTVPIIKSIQSQTKFDGLKFQCNYCSILHDDIDCIYKHWTYKSKHADAYEAFQFHIEMIGACFICNKSGTFKELKQHFNDDHPGLHFGAVNMSNKTKCLICSFNGKNMGEHFRTHHTMIMQMNLLSPIRVPANILDAVKALRVQKKFKCDYCDNVVHNTKNQIIEHYRYSMNHDIKRSPFIEFVDEQPTLAICGICQQKCAETKMLDHIQNHQIQCLLCTDFTGKINELASHYHQKHPGISMKKEKLKFGIAYLQTKLVYCNGLTLNYANVFGPKDDENEKIQSFFTTVTSPQYTQLILRSPPDEPNNHDLARFDCNRSSVSLNDSALISPSSTGSRSESSDFLRKELLQQRSYLNTLVIRGLPAAYMNNDRYLLTMFCSLCIHLQVPIEKHEIKSIYSLQNELIVKLSTRTKREQITQLMASKYCWPYELKSDAFVEIPSNEMAQTVYVNPKFTSHFHRMWMKAKYFSKQNKIHSYRLSSGGIAIRITEGGEEIFARSFEDMDNCVNGTLQTIRRRNIDLSMMPMPKRMKSN